MTRKKWSTLARPMLRIVTQHIQDLFEEFKTKDVFHQHTSLKETSWGTREFAYMIFLKRPHLLPRFMIVDHHHHHYLFSF